MKNHRGFITVPIALALLAIIAIGGGVAYVATRPAQEVNQQQDDASESAYPITAPPSAIATSAPTSTPAPTPTPTPTPAPTTTIQVPLIINGGTSPQQIGPFGCGTYLVLMDRQVPQTQGVLNAVYQWMFSNPLSFDDNNFSNIVAAYPQLDYSNVALVNGVAKVYLTGSMNGRPGHCAEPAMAAQIEQAAFQYPTVSSIEVYLNGQLFDWCTISDAPDEGFCAQGPQYWKKNK